MRLVATRSRTRLVAAMPDRLLTGFGATLNSRRRAAGLLFVALRKLPGKRLRSATYRHLSRPLSQRLRTQVEIPVYGGCRMTVDTSDISGRMLATSGIWEPHVTATLRELLGTGDGFVDVGASIGYFTLLASKLIGPQGHVYALEPSPETFARLESNLALNEASNVTPLRVAAGAFEGAALLSTPPSDNAGKAAIVGRVGDPLPGGRDSTVVTRVPLRTLASLMTLEAWRGVRAVKIDVEGYEIEALRGLEPVFESGRQPALVLEIHPSLSAGAFDYVGELCGRYRLQARELVDDDERDRESVTRSSISELAAPLDLASVRNGRNYTLLVTQQSAETVAQAERR